MAGEEGAEPKRASATGSRPLRVLSLDGGGMRGTYTATYLSRVAQAFAGKLGQTRPDRIRPARDGGEIDQTDLCPALARQHPHQIGIMHWIERMILQRAFIQRHGADKQIALPARKPIAAA